MRALPVCVILPALVVAENITIYKIDFLKKGDCAETACPSGVAHFPETFGGFKQGTCASAGYGTADGAQDYKVPVWGKSVTLSFFKKASEKEFQAGGNVTIYKIDFLKKGDCAETACSSGVAHFPETFGGFKEGSCASAGYSTADGAQDYKVPVWGKSVTLSFFKKTSEAELSTSGNVTIYKIDFLKKGDCAETACPSSVAHFPETFGGFKEGTCASAGYATADGAQDYKVPVWGKSVTLSFFKKASETELYAGGNVTIYKIDFLKKGDCAETACPSSVAHFPETFGGFKEGTCASAGYGTADGAQDYKVPVWGKSVTLSFFKKASETELEAGGNVTIYKIDFLKKGDCAQTICPSGVAHYPETFGGFKEGTCTSAGYSTADGAQDYKVPVWGKSVTLSFFKKVELVRILI